MKNKEYKLAYLTNNEVVEVIASVKKEEVQKFLKRVEETDFASYPRIQLNKVKTITETTIKTSEDIKNEFNKIANSKVIDLTTLMKFFHSESELVSYRAISLLNEFINLCDYRLHCHYELNEFGRVYRAIMLLGTKEDRKEYDEISKSLVGNAKIIRLLDNKELRDIDTLEEKNKVHKFGFNFKN